LSFEFFYAFKTKTIDLVHFYDIITAENVGTGIPLNYRLTENEIIFIATDASLTGWGATIGNAELENGELSEITYAGYVSGKFDIALACQSARHRETVAAAQGVENFKDIIRPD
jgi:hypothetical protein